MEDPEYITLRRLEDTYWWHASLRRRASSMLFEHARHGNGARLLDIGCGTAGMLAYLERRVSGVEFFGLDNNALAIALARERGVGTLLQGAADALPFGDGTFDSALALDVLYSRGVDDVLALSEAHRVLADGGILIVNLPAFEMLRGSHDLAVNTRHRYTARELREKLTYAGFEVLRITYWNMFLVPLVFVKRRLLEHGRGAVRARSDLVPLPAPVNSLFAGILGAERALMSWVDLPFGSSVFAVARKRQGTVP